MCLCDTCLASSFRRVTITTTGLYFLGFKVGIKLEKGHILTFEASDVNIIVVQDFFLGFETSEPEPQPPKIFTRSRSRSRNSSPEPEQESEPPKNVTAPHPCISWLGLVCNLSCAKLTLARIHCFATIATFGRTGGVRPPPLGVFKRSVVELSRKDQQIALAEYSRLVYCFWS